MVLRRRPHPVEPNATPAVRCARDLPSWRACAALRSLFCAWPRLVCGAIALDVLVVAFVPVAMFVLDVTLVVVSLVVYVGMTECVATLAIVILAVSLMRTDLVALEVLVDRG